MSDIDAIFTNFTNDNKNKKQSQQQLKMDYEEEVPLPKANSVADYFKKKNSDKKEDLFGESKEVIKETQKETPKVQQKIMLNTNAFHKEEPPAKKQRVEAPLKKQKHAPVEEVEEEEVEEETGEYVDKGEAYYKSIKRPSSKKVTARYVYAREHVKDKSNPEREEIQFLTKHFDDVDAKLQNVCREKADAENAYNANELKYWIVYNADKEKAHQAHLAKNRENAAKKKKGHVEKEEDEEEVEEEEKKVMAVKPVVVIEKPVAKPVVKPQLVMVPKTKPIAPKPKFDLNAALRKASVFLEDRLKQASLDFYKLIGEIEEERVAMEKIEEATVEFEEPVEKPVEKPVSKPAPKPVAKPMSKPVEKPVAKLADKPVAKPKPVVKPVEEEEESSSEEEESSSDDDDDVVFETL